MILLDLLEESLLEKQREIKKINKDKSFSIKKHLADVLNYKDRTVVYKMLEVDQTRAKLGIKDLEEIIRFTGDIQPLKDYVELLEKELQKQ